MEEEARQSTEDAEAWELFAQAREARRQEEEAAWWQEARRRAEEERREVQMREEARGAAPKAGRLARQEREAQLRAAAAPLIRAAPDPHSAWEEALSSPCPESPAR
nr:uncharacterized protein LOC127309904 [Lolium perenne]